jgi:hypothetical protein
MKQVGCLISYHKGKFMTITTDAAEGAGPSITTKTELILSATDQDNRFFRRFSWAILAFIILGFGGKAVFDTADLPPITLMHHFHAISMGSWFVLFALQATLLERGNTSLHRTLGRLSPLLVISFFIFAGIISKLNWGRIGDPLIMTSNIVYPLFFLGFYTAAILKRSDTDSHKRLMLFATLSLIGPAAGRITEIFDVSVFFAAPINLAFIFTPLVYDRFFRRKTHRATIIGTFLLLASGPIVIPLSGSPDWASILDVIMGSRGSIG